MYNLCKTKYNEEVQAFAIQQMGPKKKSRVDDGVPRIKEWILRHHKIYKENKMAITTNAICNSFKKELLQGKHDFDASSDTYKLALYTSQASIGASTENYSTTNGSSLLLVNV